MKLLLKCTELFAYFLLFYFLSSSFTGSLCLQVNIDPSKDLKFFLNWIFCQNISLFMKKYFFKKNNCWSPSSDLF